MGVFYDLYLGARNKSNDNIRMVGPWYKDSAGVVYPHPILTRNSSTFPTEFKTLGEPISEGNLNEDDRELFGYVDYSGDWNTYSSWVFLKDFFYYEGEGDIVKQGYIDEDRSMEFYLNKNNPVYIHFNLPEVYPPEYVAAHPSGNFVHIAYRDEADKSTIYYIIRSYLECFEYFHNHYDSEVEELGIIIRHC